MQVFKAYFKVIKQNLVSMMIYLFVFLGLSVLFTLSYSESAPASFQARRSDIAFVNRDGGSGLVNGLRDSLTKNANIVDVRQDAQSLQDALFYREVSYIVTVPEGFTKSFLSGSNDVQIETTSVPGSASGVYMDLMVNRYFEIANLYRGALPDAALEDIVKRVEEDIAIQTDVAFRDYGKTGGSSNRTMYFTYIAYAMMAIMVLGVTSISMTFNRDDLRRRNLCAPIRPLTMNLQLLLGNVVFALVVWFSLVALSVITRDDHGIDAQFLLFGANALALTIVCLSVAFLVGNLIKSRGAQQAIANVLSLGLCFISGVFVPQELLGASVQSVASFTPIYWYVKAVNDIAGRSQYNAAALGPIATSMLIQVGFAVAILAVALVILKQKRVSKA